LPSRPALMSTEVALSRLTLHALQVRHVGPVDLDIAPGECVCLSGASGAGKSLLLRAVADLEPHAGGAELDGERCADMRPSTWRQRVGLLPAESAWWCERVGAHFDHPRPEWFEALGFEPAVGDWEIARLSTGERQRLALLRLLCNGPRALLLDEPTASLDPAAVGRVEALLDEYRRERDCPILWVTHDPAQTERVADRRMQIHEGRVREA